MIATANGYCDFLRMLMNKGKLNDRRFLNQETIEEITSPHTQLENKSHSNDGSYRTYRVRIIAC